MSRKEELFSHQQEAKNIKEGNYISRQTLNLANKDVRTLNLTKAIGKNLGIRK